MSLRLKENGLNVPQINRQTPLDRIFTDLEHFLAIDESSKAPDALIQLYTRIHINDDDEDTPPHIQMISELLEHCFDYIHKIQQLSLEVSKRQAEDKHTDPQRAHLITISLHDMKFLNELINCIICQCIYPCLPTGVGIPIEQRRLKSFGQRMKMYKFQRCKEDPLRSYEVLESVVKNFIQVFQLGGDVAELLMKGSGLTDALTSQMVLLFESQGDISKFLELEQLSDSYNLFGIYTSLIQCTKPLNYKQFLTQRLTQITINRPSGVMNLIDFIVGLRDDEEINIEKFNNVNRILLAKPKEISSVEYFTKLFNQIYEILVFVNRPVMTSVVLNFIRVLYEKNKRIIHDFLFKKIWKALDPQLSDISKDDSTITTEKELNDVINVLISLSKSTSPDFLNELFSRIHLSLWSFYFYLYKAQLDYHKILSNVLVSVFTITSNNEMLEDIVLNLINTQGDGWKFQTTLENKLTSMVKLGPLDSSVSSAQLLDDIDIGVKCFVELLKNLSNEVVRYQFLVVLNRWILKQNVNNKKNTSDGLEEENPFIMLIDLKLLENMNESFKEVLMEKPENVLQVIKNLLNVKFDATVGHKIKDEPREVDSDDEDSDDEAEGEEEEDTQHHDNLNIVLELLSAILTETPPLELSKHTETLQEISQSLTEYPQNKYCMSLHTRIEDFLKGNATNTNANLTTEEQERIQDQELFEKAITGMNDPLIPIRAHGLHLLRQLIRKKSSVLTLEFVLELHVLQLQDQEPFIYLNVIKSLNELIWYDSHGTLEFLINYYGNKKETLDNRLKVGEVINQFIDSSGEMYEGTLVDRVMAQTLAVVRDFEEDNKMRMSAMSLIGESLRTNAQGVDKFIMDSLDCAIGILEMERTEVIMQRSAVVLIADLIAFGGLEIVPRGYGTKIKRVLEYTSGDSKDYLLVEQIQKVLSVIDELIREKFSGNGSIPSQFGKLRIGT